MKISFYKCIALAVIWFIPLLSHSASTLKLSNTSGGPGGIPFVETAGHQSRISAITIKSGNLIDSIQISYKTRNQTFKSKARGGRGGNSSTYRFERGEYITELGGKSGRYVDSIYIRTNKNGYKKWGGNGGERAFRFLATRSSPIVGLIGKSSSFIDSIGVVQIGPMTAQPQQANLLENDISGYTPPTNGEVADCETCDGAPSRFFPRPPTDRQDKDFWKRQNDRLYKVIQKLSGNPNVLNNYLRKERSSCSREMFCQIDTRSDLLTHVLDVK